MQFMVFNGFMFCCQLCVEFVTDVTMISKVYQLLALMFEGLITCSYFKVEELVTDLTNRLKDLNLRTNQPLHQK